MGGPASYGIMRASELCENSYFGYSAVKRFSRRLSGCIGAGLKVGVLRNRRGGILARTFGGGPLGTTRVKRAAQRSRTVREDWFAWIPNEMDELFDATRSDLEASNYILSISLDEALSLCKRGEFETAKQRAIVIAGLFDRLAVRVRHVIQTIKDHGSHFGIVPNVQP